MSLGASLPEPLRVLVVDDEPLARSRLKALLAQCQDPVVQWVGEAGDAVQAMAFLAHHAVDVVLCDIHMPGEDGLALARRFDAMDSDLAVVFVTAHAEHAAAAFDLDALDYLTKPVRLSRLQVALHKVLRGRGAGLPAQATAQDEALVVPVRGGLERVSLDAIVYLKAELKYVTVRTTGHHYLIEASLSELEQRLGARFVRVHRNALVAVAALMALERGGQEPAGEAWLVRMRGVDERLAVSRRQLAQVRAALQA